MRKENEVNDSSFPSTITLRETKMTNTNKPLLSLTARDLMSTAVESIPQWMSLPVAARIMSRSHISGAPVVDANGQCLGIISTTDFMTSVEHEEPNPKTSTGSAACAWQVMEGEEQPENLVRRYMTSNPVTVGPEAPIGELVQKMVDAHIHRVIVVDKDNKPLGIVSSTDVLAALAKAAQRKRQLENRS